MQKTIIAVIVLALVGAGLYYVLTMYQPNPDALSELNQEQVAQPQTNELEAGEARGTVVSVNTEQAMVDGPVLITLREESGEEAVVAVPSMGLPTCAARANMADAFAVTAGQYVEVRGAVGVDGMIIPCESADHYLRVVTPN